MRVAAPMQVASGVHQLGLGGVNGFFIEDEEGGLGLLDAGMQPGGGAQWPGDQGARLRAAGVPPRRMVTTRQFLNEAHPIGRIGLPSEAAAAVAYLASDDASLLTGVLLPVDGGYTAV